MRGISTGTMRTMAFSISEASTMPATPPQKDSVTDSTSNCPMSSARLAPHHQSNRSKEHAQCRSCIADDVVEQGQGQCRGIPLVRVRILSSKAGRNYVQVGFPFLQRHAWFQPSDNGHLVVTMLACGWCLDCR